MLRTAPVLLLLALSSAGQASPRERDCDEFTPPGTGRIRAVVVQHDERVAEVLPLLRAFSADAVVTHAAPDAAVGDEARRAGLRYIAWMTTGEIAKLAGDPRESARLGALSGLTGVYYEDDAAVEGYTSPQDQRRAYETLKAIRPSLLVLHPLRLDPIAWDRGYLDRIFRPEYTDAVVPYFYPVGTTVLGLFREEDAWRATLRTLLGEVAPRSGEKPVLPVLQAFEQRGYPVGPDFLAAQLDVYREVWPDLSSAALFEWGASAGDDPLVGFGFRPALADGARSLFDKLRGDRAARRRCGMEPLRPAR